MNSRDEVFSAVTAAIILVIVTIAPYLYGIDNEPETPLRANVRVTGHVICLVTPLHVPDVSFALEFKAAKEDAKEKMSGAKAIIKKLDEVELPVVTMQLESLGTYYITGYTALECNNNTTASGTVCHKASYANRITEPTTCAIDRSLHNFGDLFYLPAFDTVYVAEDTGSAVKGKHLDLYFWDDEYSYALSITGYYEVYSVEFIYGTVQANKYDIQKLVAEKVIGWKIKEV